jgi:hypothetical protein
MNAEEQRKLDQELNSQRWIDGKIVYLADWLEQTQILRKSFIRDAFSDHRARHTVYGLWYRNSKGQEVGLIVRKCVYLACSAPERGGDTGK